MGEHERHIACRTVDCRLAIIMTIDLRHHRKEVAAPPVRIAQTPRVPEEAYVPKVRAAPKRTQERLMMTIMAGAAAIVVLMLLGYGVTKIWGYIFAGTDRELRSLVSDVGNHMLLPTDETPTLATVSDMHALEGQEFFKHAEEGDKVLMYLRSRRAIIYRPSIDKIIEVGPITGAEE